MGGLVTPDEARRHKRAYVIDPHLFERARFMVRARASQLPKGEDESEWAYHLRFVWVPTHVPGGESVLGHWQRHLCGPAFVEPDMAWVT